MFSLLLVLMHISYIGAFHPDISLKGNISKFNNQSIINLKCSTTLPSIGCTVEYLINGISVDDLRSSNNICYHSKNVCDFKICACSNSCKEFILNITVKESNAVDDTKFTCISRIKIGWQIYMATISILQHGNTFRVFEKTLEPITVMTLAPDVSTNHSDQDTALEIKDVVVIVCSALSAVLVFFILFILKKVKRKCCKRNDGIHVRKSKQSDVFITNSNMDSISSQCKNAIVTEEGKMHSRDSSGDSNQSDELKIISKLLVDRKAEISVEISKNDELKSLREYILQRKENMGSLPEEKPTQTSSVCISELNSYRTDNISKKQQEDYV